MKRIFVDTNIIVDLLADRKPFSKFAIELFSKAESGQVKLYASSHSVATAYYLLKKYGDEKKLREVLLSLLAYLHIVAVDNNILVKGLRSKFQDFEDAMQIFAATAVPRIECIVTRNTRDFRGAQIPVLAPDELAAKL
jgi:predicted nucleic acid-binding protein